MLNASVSHFAQVIFSPNGKFSERFVSQAYTEGGVAAISVLTEPVWFKGNLEDLRNARQVQMLL